MNIQLRRATLKDLSTILNLFVGTINNVCIKDYNTDQLRVWAASIENRNRWNEKIIKQYFIVATTHNEIIGFGSLDGHDYVDLLYIHQRYQRKGVASKIYNALEIESKKLGAKILKSDVSKTAKGFFEKEGFKVIATQNEIFDKIEISNFKMEKLL